jgi:predicted nicotinamide N-methyase
VSFDITYFNSIHSGIIEEYVNGNTYHDVIMLTDIIYNPITNHRFCQTTYFRNLDLV